MSDFSRDELDVLDVLAGARRALEPTARDTARVLHNARLAIGSGAVPAADAALASGAGKGAMTGALAKQAASWLAVAGIAAWLGYHAGLSAGELRAREANAASTRAATAPASLAPRTGSAPNVPAQPSVPSSEARAPASEAAPTARAAAQPRRKPKIAPEVDEAPALAPEVDEAPALAAPPPAPSASLDAEIKALRYVERALRNREPHNALARLAQLDREVPDGQMKEERAAAQAMARCEERARSGAPDHAQVMQRVLEFSQQYPASVYFARVRQTCLATIDRDAATD